MNNALIEAMHQIEIEDATAELVAFVKANPVKRNKSGSLNGNSVGSLADKWAHRFVNNGRNIGGYSVACEVIRDNA